METTDSITYANPLQEQLDYLVYDEKYELDPANLKLLHILGSGHFGDVYMGILKLNGANIPVAVKKTKLLADKQQIELKSPEECDEIRKMERDSLRDELKVMAHVGGHSNVVKLLGAITTNRDDYCLVTEYCEYGSLDAFLRNKKDRGLFINETVTKDDTGYQIRGRDCVYKSMLDVTWDSQFELRRAEGTLTTSDLLWFALQMARAMEYLTKQSVVHRDVALRNVLLKSDYTLKVADFGLSRLAGDDGYYYQLRNVAMPIRYTAPEAMKVGRFSEHSECWAYGVALWELFTFSKKQPYAEECPEGYRGIMIFLAAGNRLPIPDTTPKPIRLLIEKLWLENPAKRPCFEVCQRDISKELSFSCAPILVRRQLDYDVLSIKRTSLDDVDLVQNLHNYLQKKKKTPVKNIYYKIVPERQSRLKQVTFWAASVAAVILALIAISVAVFRLNCLSEEKIPEAYKSAACYPKVNWTTANGQIFLNGEQLVVKGINYHGFESDEFSPYGLLNQSLDFVLDIAAGNEFNAIRFSFSIEKIQKNPEININCEKNPELCHLRSMDLMEAVIDRCAERGILVVLVCNQLTSGSNYSQRNGLWYDDKTATFSEANVLEAWDMLMERVKQKWNLFALDVLDQPHGASWGANDAKKDFNRFAERFVKHISSKHVWFKGFFFIEGVYVTHRNTQQDNSAPGAFQGENLMAVRTDPISTGNSTLDRRIIYSPHSFGPDVWNQTYFNSPSKFPENLTAIWENFFGFITNITDNPVVVGSWGGKYQSGTVDEIWQNAFARWLNEKCLTNQFYWCLNGPYDATFGDPILSDLGTTNERKLDLLKKLQPYPTRLTCLKSTSQLLITSRIVGSKTCHR